MSDELPERSEMIRSTVITAILAAVFMIIALTFWAWSSLPETEISPIDILNDINPYITILIESLSMLGVYIFLTVTIVNLRLFISQVRAGWFEVISFFILVLIMSWLMFGVAVASVAAIFSLGAIVYLYLLQE